MHIDLDGWMLLGIGGWLAFWVEVFADALIAFDRLVAICFWQRYEEMFTRSRSIALSVFVWIVAFAASVPILAWILPSSYFVASVSNWFDYYTAEAHLYNIVQAVIQVGTAGLCLLAYGCCIGYLIWRKHKAHGTQGLATRRAQRNLMIQGLLHFSLLVIAELTFLAMNWYHSFWLCYSASLFAQLVPLSTTVITLALNSQIRDEVKKMRDSFRGSTSSSSVIVTVTERLNH